MVLKENLSGRDKAEALKRELSAMEEERHEMEADWDTAQHFVSSVILRFNADEDDTGKAYEVPKRVTSDPANFLETLISGICGYSVNENILWFKLGLQDKKLENRYGVKDWEEEGEGSLYAEFNRSNFYAQIPLFVENAILYGHGVMLIDENIEDTKIRFSTMSAREIYLDTNEYDEVDTVFRKFSMKAEDAVSYFGYEKMSGEVKALWDNKEDRNKKITILHGVYRNKSSKGKAAQRDGFTYSSVFVDLRHDHIIKESGYDTFPYAVFIWKKISGKKYGIGPALMAVNDIKLLFMAEESRTEIAQMSAHPPLMVPDRLKGTEELLPGGRYYYKEGLPIKSIEVGSNYPITLEVTKEYIERVKSWFHVDFFLMLQRQSRQMTATEVLELQGEKAAVLSVMINNLNSALQKIVHRSVDILFRQRRMPPLPRALQESETGLKVDFIGVLAQAQKKAHQTAGIMQGIQIIGAMAQMARGIPQASGAFDFVNFQEFLKRGLESVGLSQKIIREDDEVEEERRARAEAQAAMEEKQAAVLQQEMVTQNYDKLNEPVKKGSPMAALAEMGGGV